MTHAQAFMQNACTGPSHGSNLGQPNACTPPNSSTPTNPKPG